MLLVMLEKLFETEVKSFRVAMNLWDGMSKKQDLVYEVDVLMKGLVV